MVRPVVNGHQAQWIEKLKAVMDDLDLEIRDIIVTLNTQGLRTIMSCAGHPGLPGFKDIRGFIWFANHLNKTELISKLKTFGLKDIKVEWDDENGETTIASFAPIGEPKRFFDFGSLIFSLTLP